jgi:transcriptional regulator with XRE-family HTH domain
MKIETRNNRIKTSKLSITELAKRYGVSYERARQIRKGEEERRLKQIEKIRKEYKKNVNELIRNNLTSEIKRLSNKGRQKKIIIQKTILIKALKDNFNYSITNIAKLFKNDHTTIMYLYLKQD